MRYNLILPENSTTQKDMGGGQKMCECGECEQTGVLTLLISDLFY